MRPGDDRDAADTGEPARPCPVCDCADGEAFFTLRDMPVLCNVFWPSRAAAREAPVADIVLTFCPSCGMIYNQSFDATLSEYESGYENALHHSPRFRRYAEKTARDLIERHALRESAILDIGSGDGYFLELLCRMGDNRGLGLDPSMQGRAATSAPHDRVAIIPEYFAPRHVAESPALVCCRHVLEHIEDPLRWLRQLRSALGDRAPALYFEVPNARWMLRSLLPWEVIHEHCSYFTASSLDTVFRRAGFEITGIAETYGDQFLAIEARPAASPSGTPLPEAASTGDSGLRTAAEETSHFGDACQKTLVSWRSRLRAAHRGSGGVVVWGAGARGVTFLNSVDPDGSVIDRIVDLNPRKQGKFVPRSGQSVVGPEALKRDTPGTVLVMNSLYVEEIERTLEENGLAVDLETV